MIIALIGLAMILIPIIALALYTIGITIKEALKGDKDALKLVIIVGYLGVAFGLLIYGLVIGRG